jgi:hypothetical protein
MSTLRESIDVAVAQEMHICAELIRAEAHRSAVPDHRLGMLQAAAMLENGATDD